MKRALSLILALVMCMAMAACGGPDGSGGHTCSGEWVVLEDATCLKAGTRQRTCTCGEVSTEAIPVLAHTFEAEICTACSTADPNYKPTASSGLRFESNGDGTCSVTGIGSCTDTDIVIPETADNGDRVVKLAESAFHGQSITSVWIPDSVKTIDVRAFYGCENLTKVVIGNGVEVIENYAFAVCKQLITLSIGNGVTTIEEGAFCNCPSLMQVNLPKTVISIGANTFAGCISLREIVIPSGVTEIQGNTFGGCTNLQSVHLGAGVEKIGSGAFKNCTALCSVYISDLDAWCNITFKDLEANPMIQGCDLYLNAVLLTDLVIPEGMTVLGSNFRGCTSLVTVTTPGTLERIDDYAFHSCTNLKEIVISEGVSRLGYGAFYGCTALTKVTVLATAPLSYASQFENCPALQEIHVPAAQAEHYRNNWSAMSAVLKLSNQPVESIPDSEGLEFTSNGNGTCYVSGRGSCADTVIKIPKTSPAGDTVTQIGERAFAQTFNQSCEDITQIIVPNTVTGLGDHAFEGCYNLRSLDLPESLTLGYAYMLTENGNLTVLTLRSAQILDWPLDVMIRPEESFYQEITVYVPAELVEEYKAASGWSPFGDNIRAITE